jgi:predicted nucleic acid-binding protein
MHLDSCLIDTNILIRTIRRQGSSYPEVSGAVDRLISAGTPLFYTHQNIAEMWNVMTRPVNANGLGLAPHQADTEVQSVERAMKLLPENEFVYQQWRALVMRYQVCGVRVHDTRLVAVMLASGVKYIMTLNVSDFPRFSETEAIHPQAVLSGTN